MNTDLAIKENDLELVVSEKELGHLTTNAIQIREIVKAALPTYDISNYNDDNIEQAKKDKASLNKAAKALNSKRIEIEKEFMRPFGEFKEIVTETVQLISQCSTKIDDVIKQNDQIYKDNKKAAIVDYFEANNANLIDLGKIFKPEWLNKTAKEKFVFGEIDSILSQIDNDITTIESLEDADVLVTYYKDTLNLSSTIQYGNRLKEQRERAKVAEEARKKAEEERLRIQEDARQQAANQQPVTPTPSNPFVGYTPTSQIPFEEVVPQENAKKQPELLTRAFKVTTTRENIIALGDFMNERGIDFDKIEIP